MAKNFQKPPNFGEDKPFTRYVEELRAWTFVTDIDKKKQGLAVALSLPEDDKSQIRDKVFSEIDIATLKEDDGVETLITFLNNIFQKDELTEVYEHYVNFDRFHRNSKQNIDAYILEFEKLYNKTKKFKLELPKSVLAFKLLDNAGLQHNERLLVLTGVNYNEKDTLLKQMKGALKKFFGKQTKPINFGDCSLPSIKHEPEQNHEVNATFLKNGNSYKGRYNARRKAGGQRNFSSTTTSNRNSSRRSNPVDPTGNPMRCMVCQSIMHFVRDCPHAYENNAQSFTTSEEFALYTGHSQTEMTVLLSCKFCYS